MVVYFSRLHRIVRLRSDSNGARFESGIFQRGWVRRIQVRRPRPANLYPPNPSTLKNPRFSASTIGIATKTNNPMQSGKIDNHARTPPYVSVSRKRGQPVVGAFSRVLHCPQAAKCASEVLQRQSSPVIHAIDTEQTFEASTGSGYFAHAFGVRISGFNTNVHRDSSQQWCTRVSEEEAFDSLGSFLGCPLRISSAQLASLDSI